MNSKLDTQNQPKACPFMLSLDPDRFQTAINDPSDQCPSGAAPHPEDLESMINVLSHHTDANPNKKACPKPTGTDNNKQSEGENPSSFAQHARKDQKKPQKSEASWRSTDTVEINVPPKQQQNMQRCSSKSIQGDAC